MKLKSSKIYHLFWVIAILNFLVYYLFIGHSVIDIHKADNNYFSDNFFLFFACISLLVIIIWLTYWLFRKKIASDKLIWIHLLVTFIAVIVLPLVMISIFEPTMPRRYIVLDNDADLLGFLGNLKTNFLIVALVLLISESFLFVNLK